MHLCDSSSSATNTIDMFGVQLYEAQHGAATIHKTSKMTHIFHIDEKIIESVSKCVCALPFHLSSLEYLSQSKIWGSHSSAVKDSSLPGRDTVSQDK